MPSQKSGIEYSASEVCPIAVSRVFPLNQAEITPSRVPMIIESTVARPSRSSVLGIAILSSSTTDCSLVFDVPRSPCASALR